MAGEAALDPERPAAQISRFWALRGTESNSKSANKTVGQPRWPKMPYTDIGPLGRLGHLGHLELLILPPNIANMANKAKRAMICVRHIWPPSTRGLPRGIMSG